jgi:Plasma-membrane choline transporter
VIACAASVWYFTRSDGQTTSPISTGFKWAFKYHIGSLAFASLLLAIMFVLRVIVQYLNVGLLLIKDSLKKLGKNDKDSELMLKCVSCMIMIFEKFLKFFNKHSYIQIALTSENYCTASRNAMKIVGNNFLRFGILHGLGEIVMNMVVVFIALMGTYLSYLILQRHSPEIKDMQGAAPSLMIVLGVQAAIGKLFMHIWEISADTIMHCHCIDEELGGGRAANAPERLKNALDKHGGSYGYH